MAANTTGNITAETKTFYDTTLLDQADYELIHRRWGTERPLPSRQGQTINFRRFERLSTKTVPLTEGVTPSEDQQTVTTVTATPLQYGTWQIVTDVLDWTGIDPVMTEIVQNQGVQAGQTLDNVCRDVILAGSTVRYANGRAGRTSIVSTDLINGVELRKLRRTLRNNVAKKAEGSYYPLIVSPNTLFDLQAMPEWVSQAVYSRPDQLDSGEVPHIYGFAIHETEQAKVFTGGGSGGIDVYGSLGLGKGYFGNSTIAGHALQTLRHQAEPSASDPLAQRNTAAWKAMYVAIRLNELWGARLEHAVTA